MSLLLGWMACPCALLDLIPTWKFSHAIGFKAIQQYILYFKIHMQTQLLEQKGKVGLHAMLIPKGKLVNNSQKWLQSTEERRQLASRIRMSARDCWDKLLLCLYLPPPVINLRLLLLQ
jgi:hypothetical protein